MSDSPYRPCLLLPRLPRKYYQQSKAESIPRKRKIGWAAKRPVRINTNAPEPRKEATIDLQARESVLVQLPLDDQERGWYERKFSDREIGESHKQAGCQGR